MSNLALRTPNGTSLEIPGVESWHANPGDPAISVMTDFREHTSITVSSTAAIDAALEHMKHTGVRCAFAVDEQQQRIIGLITAYDITSEKPMRHLQLVAGTRQEVLVKDIMQRLVDWKVADIKDIERVTVANVARLFEETRLTHIPVFEANDNGQQRLRGLLSGAKVKRLLARQPM